MFLCIASLYFPVPTVLPKSPELDQQSAHQHMLSVIVPVNLRLPGLLLRS